MPAPRLHETSGEARAVLAATLKAGTQTVTEQDTADGELNTATCTARHILPEPTTVLEADSTH